MSSRSRSKKSGDSINLRSYGKQDGLLCVAKVQLSNVFQDALNHAKQQWEQFFGAESAELVDALSIIDMPMHIFKENYNSYELSSLQLANYKSKHQEYNAMVESVMAPSQQSVILRPELRMADDGTEEAAARAAVREFASISIPPQQQLHNNQSEYPEMTELQLDEEEEQLLQETVVPMLEVRDRDFNFVKLKDGGTLHKTTLVRAKFDASHKLYGERNL